jgi:hypothetical protein
VKGLTGATDRLSWCEVIGAPGIKLHASPRSGTTISEYTQTTFKARQTSGDEIACDIVLNAPSSTPIQLTLVSSKKELSQTNPYVYDMRLQLHPNGLSGVITIVLGNDINQGSVTLPSLTAVGDYVAN